ncbi:hypothetical protein Naga_100704g3 [Nannochloropsis gaditana]|uniref:Uncharacterized protein n=1 Tax=Nannochloropsis gaditana TaxID=72520 RepID=W7TIB6_9STRA|nr:hypothetical protein Naga_100704g3 [Nannochloropsis gaditana]
MLDLCKRLRQETIIESIRSSFLGLVDPWKQENKTRSNIAPPLSCTLLSYKSEMYFRRDRVIAVIQASILDRRDNTRLLEHGSKRE